MVIYPLPCHILSCLVIVEYNVQKGKNHNNSRNINIACTSKGMIQAFNEELKKNVYSAVNSSGS